MEPNPNQNVKSTPPEQRRVKPKKQTRPPKVYGIRSKQRKYALARGQGATKTEAAKEAYPATKYPAQVGHKLDQHPKVQEAIQTFTDYFNRRFSDKRLADKGEQLLEAHVGDQPAWETQRKTWETLIKMKSPQEQHLHLHKNEFITQLAEKAVEEN